MVSRLEMSQGDVIIRVFGPAREQQVLRVLAVDEHANCCRLAAFLSPVAGVARRVDHRYSLAGGGRIEDLVDRQGCSEGGSRDERQQQKGGRYAQPQHEPIVMLNLIVRATG